MIPIPRLLQIRLKECHETVKMQCVPLAILLSNHKNQPIFLKIGGCIVLIRMQLGTFSILEHVRSVSDLLLQNDHQPNGGFFGFLLERISLLITSSRANTGEKTIVPLGSDRLRIFRIFRQTGSVSVHFLLVDLHATWDLDNKGLMK